MTRRKKQSILHGRRTVVFSVAAALIVSVIAGCLPSRTPVVVVCQAPTVDTEKASPEYARHREEYLRNRAQPPEQYHVPPKPPRNNQFGEFQDELYQSLDTQPALPRLPGDGLAGSFGSGYPPPPASFANSAPALPPPATRQGAAVAGPVARPAGIDAGGRFYPVEQLVFGGDQPDLDKPERYRLMPKDVITVTVKDHPEFSGQMEIQPDGTVRIPTADDLVRLRGLTVDAAAGAIGRTLELYVVGECRVRVQANRARGGYYYVFGDVNQAGRFPMGLEPVRLSEAVLAANWEVNPARNEDELGPAFPAASPRGRYTAPATADMARVMLVTPHRSQPVRTVHDVRTAMLGVTADDPLLRPGQIVIVPSLDPARNRLLGLDLSAPVPQPIPAREPGMGFANANAPARLPEIQPPPRVEVPSADSWSVSAVEANMSGAFGTSFNSSGSSIRQQPAMYVDPVTREGGDAAAAPGSPAGAAKP